MSKLLALLPVVLATSAFATKLTETRKIADFTAIEVSDGVTLEVKKGATSLTIEGDDNVVPLYTTEVVSGVLKIRRKDRGIFRNRNEVVVRVSTATLKRIEASGGVNATLDAVADRTFEANLSGGVEFNAKRLDVDSLNLDASGGVNVRADGSAKMAKLHASGGVGVKAKELKIASVDLDASGGCDLEVTARESISGEISGGVGVKVYGNPPKSRVKASGGADVDYLD
ncbi:MAG: head GIN domain-containing protein [Archangium sp.]